MHALLMLPPLGPPYVQGETINPFAFNSAILHMLNLRLPALKCLIKFSYSRRHNLFSHSLSLPSPRLSLTLFMTDTLS